jgi:site-specific recombinase XerD
MSQRAPRPSFATILQDFFLRHLMVEKGASPHTVAAYRDTFRLLLNYAEKRLKKAPTDVVLADLSPALLLGFLDHLETQRRNSVRTRNARLAVLRSFLQYAGSRDVLALPDIQGSLAIPAKRYDKQLLGFLSRAELDAILSACNRQRWSGERDYVLLSVAYNTGARISELVGLTVQDVDLVRGASVRFLGKGRKLRQVPLWRRTAALVRTWLDRIAADPEQPLFPNRWGRPVTRSAIEKRLRLLALTARGTCPSLAGRRISPHTLRHTTAMHMLQAGVDITTLALWLGHADPASTHAYVEADLAMKARALRKLEPIGHGRSRFRPGDRLLAFLDRLGGPRDPASIMRSCQP